MSSSEQLPLELRSGCAVSRADIMVCGANREVVTFLETWPKWPTPIVILSGSKGVGKSHLAGYWAGLANAEILQSDRDLSWAEPSSNCLVLEDVARGRVDEKVLFHLINSVRSANGHLLITSSSRPASWKLSLPDLKSRFKLAHLIELQEPDDELLFGVMSKLFAELQVDVDSSVIDYLVLRMERTLSCASRLVSLLDQMSIAQKRPITKPLAAMALQRLGLN